MLLKKIPLLNDLKKDITFIYKSIKENRLKIDEDQNKFKNLSEEIEEIKSSVIQKDILLINLVKEIEKIKSEKNSLEKDLLTLVSAISSLHILVESLMIEEYGDDNYKKKFNYH